MEYLRNLMHVKSNFHDIIAEGLEEDSEEEASKGLEALTLCSFDVFLTPDHPKTDLIWPEVSALSLVS